MEKLFLICICENNGVDFGKDKITQISDHITDLLGKTYKRVTVVYSQTRKIRRYYVSQFEKISLQYEEWDKVSFSFLPPKTSWFNNFQFMLEYRKKSDNKLFIKLSALYENIDADFFKEKALDITETLRSLFNIQWLAADTMPQSKSVELFANGVLTEELSEYEKEIAASIGRSIHSHYKLPYLFLFNYINGLENDLISAEKIYTADKNGLILYYPDLFWHEFNEYVDCEAWNSDFKLLRDEEIIKND